MLDSDSNFNMDVKTYKVLVYTANLIARSSYGRYFVLKGGTVLMTKVIDSCREDLFRRTTDIDIHVSNLSVWVSFLNDIESILNNNNAGIRYSILSVRSRDKKGGVIDNSDSIGILAVLPDSCSIKMKIDMNIKEGNLVGIEFISALSMNTYDSVTMLTDKLVVISSQKIFRRIKDVYDIAVLTSISDFSIEEIYNRLYKKHGKRKLDRTYLNVENYAELKHAYDKYSGIRVKREFDVLFTCVSNFCAPIYEGKHNIIWKSSVGRWVHI